MTRLHRLLAIMTVATMLLGNVNAEGEAYGVLHNATISCSAKLPSITIGCFLERPVFVTGAFEVAVGIDAQAALRGGESHLAPYAIAAYYAPAWSAWVEFIFPDLGIPVIGSPDWLRAGFTYRFQ